MSKDDKPIWPIQIVGFVVLFIVAQIFNEIFRWVMRKYR